MTTIRFPIFNSDVAFTVSPREVLFNCVLLFGMTAIVGIIQGKLLQCRKMALDAIEPRGIGRRPVKPDVVGFCIRQHLGLMMVRRIIQNNMQRFLSRILPAQPFQKRQMRRPVLLRRKRSNQRIPFQIVSPEHMSHAAVAIVRRPQSVHMAGSSIMPAMPRQKIQRAELVDTDPAAARGTLGIQPLDSPVFGPKLGIRRVLPGLGMPPFDLAAMQDLTQRFQRNRRDDLLSDKILSQFGQRPDGHADQLLRRRQSNLTDLFTTLGDKLFGTAGSAKAGQPINHVHSAVVEAVNDLPHPCGRTVALFGNLCVCVAASRQQNNSRVKPIDSIGQLLFHTFEFSAFPWPKRPRLYRVHFGFSTLSGLPHAACGELIYNTIHDGASPNLKIPQVFSKIIYETLLLETALVFCQC